MRPKWTFAAVGLILGLVLYMTAVAQSPVIKADGVSAQEDLSTSISNSYVRVDSDANGQFVIGTTGGNPGITTDDNKRLLFGFEEGGSSSIWSSFTTVRVADGGTPSDYAVNLDSTRVTSASTTTGSSMVTVWGLPEGVQVTQSLSLITNPFSGRSDMVRIAYTLVNQDDAAHTVGVRAMLDVMVGDNDAAPYFIPGAGNSNKEQQYDAGSIPPYYYAFESDTYAADSLKGQGILSGFGMTEPDRFLITSWRQIYDSTDLWDYAVDTTAMTGGSATVMYWNPKSLAPGQSVTYVTAYGLAGGGGDSSWISGPVTVGSDTPSFQATIWINNTTNATFTGGQATIILPAGLSLSPAPGALTQADTATKAIGDVAPGAIGQATWTVYITGGLGTYPYSVVTTFTGGSGPLTAQGQIEVTNQTAAAYLPVILLSR